jgi:hypothetical protein
MLIVGLLMVVRLPIKLFAMSLPEFVNPLVRRMMIVRVEVVQTVNVMVLVELVPLPPIVECLMVERFRVNLPVIQEPEFVDLAGLTPIALLLLLIVEEMVDVTTVMMLE